MADDDPFVLDASTTLSRAVDDEGVALVPSLWHHEVVNGLAVGVRKRRLTQQQAGGPQGRCGAAEAGSPTQLRWRRYVSRSK